jgi:sodium-dependent dicarboxylate transporter 2/3/5
MGKALAEENPSDAAHASLRIFALSGQLSRIARRLDPKRLSFILLGIVLFAAVYYSPPWADAIDPEGHRILLTHEGKAAIGLFCLAVTWWIFEVVPVGITGISIGVCQALFLIRPAREAFGDFLNPAVWFVLGSILIGMAFSRTGLTKRMAYKMLVLVGEKTSRIYLGSFLMIAVLTLVMAHTAVAATMFPLLMAINSLYGEEDKPTRFGKGLFIGMSFIAGASSIITLLGSARAVVAIGFFSEMMGKEISFSELTYYMLPIGGIMMILIWILMMMMFTPEHDSIPGLRDRAKALYAKLEPISRNEILTLVFSLSIITLLFLRSLVPALQKPDKSAFILIATILFFLFRILKMQDLEDLPWNIALLFGGAMSLGFCLWETGASRWLAIRTLALLQGPILHPLVFVMATAILILILTNFVVNVAVIALVLPVALVMAPYLHIAPEIIFFAGLTTAGMPFLLLIGAAPNAIAYESRQFTSRQFFLAGIPATILVVIVLILFVRYIWPMMGMPGVH